MKNIDQFINEGSNKYANGEWCLWEYKDNGERIILIWKSNGKDQSDVTDIDEHGIEIMNVEFDTIIGYCKKHKNDNIDKFYLDFSNANWDKIKDIFA